MRMVLVVLMTWGVMGYVLVPDDLLDGTRGRLSFLVAGQ